MQQEIRKRAQKANKKKKPATQPKANGTKPVVNPSSQIHAINEVVPKPSANSVAFTSKAPNSSPSASNKNHILTRVQNHTSNGENHLTISAKNQVCNPHQLSIENIISDFSIQYCYQLEWMKIRLDFGLSRILKFAPVCMNGINEVSVI